MVLAIDVGNTNIVIALYDNDERRGSWRMSTDKNRSADELGMFFTHFLTGSGINTGDIDDVIISSVVPPIMHSLGNTVKKYFHVEPMIIGNGVDAGIKILYDNPGEVGADRIVNAVGAVKKYGAPLIIVDFGTATTFCAVNGRGEYLGGVITAGISISMDALFQRAAKLPKIELLKPDTVIGKNTVSSMQSGAYFGQIGQADYIVRKMKAEMGEDNIKVIATGGLSSMISSGSDCIDIVDKTLTLDGLMEIYRRNKHRSL